MDHRLLISAVHYRVRKAWFVLEPYVEAERAIRGGSTYLAYFEHLARVAGEADVRKIHHGLGLKKIGPYSARFTAEFADGPH